MYWNWAVWSLCLSCAWWWVCDFCIQSSFITYLECFGCQEKLLLQLSGPSLYLSSRLQLLAVAFTADCITLRTGIAGSDVVSKADALINVFIIKVANSLWLSSVFWFVMMSLGLLDMAFLWCLFLQLLPDEQCMHSSLTMTRALRPSKHHTGERNPLKEYTGPSADVSTNIGTNIYPCFALIALTVVLLLQTVC